MPRTKLDKYSSKAHLRNTKKTIKMAMARHPFIETQAQLAEAIGSDQSSVSKWINKELTDYGVIKMHRVLHFTPEELEVLLCK